MKLCVYRKQCLRPGKHPRTRTGHIAATTDTAHIRKWWTKWPDANIGIATGAAGLVVIDIDERHGGGEAWEHLVERVGSYRCDTATVMTGGGGEHLYFEAPEGVIIASSEGELADGIDVRANGGYVIAPPSMHACGKTYEWFDGCNGSPVALPDQLVELLRSPSTSTESSEFAPSLTESGPISEGQRNRVLFLDACSLRGRGASQENIYTSLRVMNVQRCSPPLSDHELRSIARSASKYRPNGAA